MSSQAKRTGLVGATFDAGWGWGPECAFGIFLLPETNIGTWSGRCGVLRQGRATLGLPTESDSDVLMFESVKLLGSDEYPIALDTRMRNGVHNCQAPPVDDQARQKFNLLLNRHRSWELRKPPCGFYNCFGHLWASRRTAIYEQAEVDKIFKDDGYRQLALTDTLRGDVAAYLDPTGQNLYHCGILYERRPLTIPNGTPIGEPTPWILSKWNDSSGEVLHHWNDVPWAEDDFMIEWWTERPL